MIYYANPSTEAIRDEMAAGRLGCIVTPHQGNVTFPDDGWDVIADNGCFSAKWSEKHWFNWLIGLPRSVRFAVCPDVFDPTGGPCHEPTLARWAMFSSPMRRHGFVPAFVLQNGATPHNLPDDAEVLFIGGDDRYKLGPVVWDICQAHADRWIHMGRVNSQRRFHTARAVGCDSVDGTYLTYGPDQNLPRLMSWLKDAHAQPQLWEAV